MAFACAFAVLGDVYLAQDTAQEAFIVAWQKLEQLREPAAFPGWFKRIVLTQYNRLTRCKALWKNSSLTCKPDLWCDATLNQILLWASSRSKQIMRTTATLKESNSHLSFIGPCRAEFGVVRLTR